MELIKKEKIEQYPLKLRESLMEKARNQSLKEDISFNQWLRNAIKKQLKVK